MNPIDILKKEHDEIEQELLELEAVIEDDVINYANFIHVFKNFCGLWNQHEEKEEKVFNVFEKEQIKVPVYKMTCEHKDLRGHIEKIKAALKSNSEHEVRKSFENVRTFIDLIRKHKIDEDEILYTIAVSEFTPEEWKEIGRVMKEF